MSAPMCDVLMLCGMECGGVAWRGVQSGAQSMCMITSTASTDVP